MMDQAVCFSPFYGLFDYLNRGRYDYIYIYSILVGINKNMVVKKKSGRQSGLHPPYDASDLVLIQFSNYVE